MSVYYVGKTTLSRDISLKWEVISFRLEEDSHEDIPPKQALLLIVITQDNAQKELTPGQV